MSQYQAGDKIIFQGGDPKGAVVFTIIGVKSNGDYITDIENDLYLSKIVAENWFRLLTPLELALL